jgi:hypothetical protein
MNFAVKIGHLNRKKSSKNLQVGADLLFIWINNNVKSPEITVSTPLKDL